jgi:hypothetical protein
MHARRLRPTLLAILVIGCHGAAAPVAPALSSEAATRPPTPRKVSDDWVSPCLAALHEKHDSEAQQVQRVLAACTACGVPWTPVLASHASPQEVGAVLDACELPCPTAAEEGLRSALAALPADASSAPAWRAFASACPAALGHPGPRGEFANGTWFALHQIGLRLGEASARLGLELDYRPLYFALPVVDGDHLGPSFTLPPSRDYLEPTGGRFLVVTPTHLTAASAPSASITLRGLELDHPDRGYPGAEIALDQAGSAFVAGNVGDIAAPATLPAARIFEVARAIGKDRQFRLAGLVPADDAVMSPQLGWSMDGFEVVELDGPALAIDATVARAAVVDRSGHVLAAARIPGATLDERMRWVRLEVRDPARLRIEPGTASVADLVAMLGVCMVTCRVTPSPIDFPARDGTVEQLERALASASTVP